MSRKLVIYHASCVDGFTAAWACWRKFGDEAEYLPANYGDAMPNVLGRDVTIVDFSYPRRVLEAIAGESDSLLVLDHHKTAQAELEGLPYCKFDMSRSGAGLAWDELHEDVRPRLVEFVEDRDLWRWNLPHSREVSAWLSSWPRSDFASWDKLGDQLEADLGGCVAEGGAILRALNGYVEGLSSKGRICRVGDHDVPVINTTHATSELVGKLAESALFAVGWFQRHDGQFIYSLRSRGDFDVSAVAKQFGGGGHKNAAGFTVSSMVHE